MADLEALATHHHLVMLTSLRIVAHRAIKSSQLVVCSRRRGSAPACDRFRKTSRTSEPDKVVVMVDITSMLEYVANEVKRE